MFNNNNKKNNADKKRKASDSSQITGLGTIQEPAVHEFDTNTAEDIIRNLLMSNGVSPEGVLHAVSKATMNTTRLPRSTQNAWMERSTNSIRRERRVKECKTLQDTFDAAEEVLLPAKEKQKKLLTDRIKAHEDRSSINVAGRSRNVDYFCKLGMLLEVLEKKIEEGDEKPYASLGLQQGCLLVGLHFRVVLCDKKLETLSQLSKLGRKVLPVDKVTDEISHLHEFGYFDSDEVRRTLVHHDREPSVNGLGISKDIHHARIHYLRELALVIGLDDDVPFSLQESDL